MSEETNVPTRPADGSTASGRSEDRLWAALDRYPDAVVTLLDPVTYEFPAAEVRQHLRIDGHEVTDGYHALPLIDPRSHPLLLTQTFRFEDGVVTDPVVLADGRPGLTMMFDLRESYGMFVALLTAVVSAVPDAEVAPQALTPKVTRYRADGLGTVVWVEPGAEAPTVPGTTSLEPFHPDDRPELLRAWAVMIARPDSANRVRVRYALPGEAWLWVEMTFHNHLDDPDDGTVHVEVLDISREMALLEEAQLKQAFFAGLAETLPVGVLQVDARRNVTFANAEMTRYTGQPSTSDLTAWLAGVAPTDRARLHQALDRALAAVCDENIEVELDGPDGSHHVCAVRVRSVQAGATIGGALLSLTDVTESAHHRAALEVQVRSDNLTGVLNRSGITGALDDLLASAAPDGPAIAVIFIDLDNFKPVNDRFGHAAGDHVLIEAAARIRSVLRDTDLVGRLGGDEFVVLCARTSPETTLEVAARINDRLRQAMPGPDTSIAITASIGVAWTDGPTDRHSLLARADMAMYAAKQAGGDTIRRWTDSLPKDLAPDAPSGASRA
jgi:diguanylate cyclase (GGDEF)-like protein